MELIYGVGLNDVDYVTQIREDIGYVGGKRKRRIVWVCPFYVLWINMLRRCYDEKALLKQPTYNGATVTEDWHKLSKLKAWAEQQDYVGKHLDKDIILVGNKLYSPETCAFVTQATNSFITASDASRGDCLIGCGFHKLTNKFQAYCNNPFTKKREHLGLFLSEKEAHEAWRKRKHELAQLVAETESDQRVVEALKKRYSAEEWYKNNPISS